MSKTQGKARFGKGRVNGCECNYHFTCRKCLENCKPPIWTSCAEIKSSHSAEVAENKKSE